VLVWLRRAYSGRNSLPLSKIKRTVCVIFSPQQMHPSSGDWDFLLAGAMVLNIFVPAAEGKGWKYTTMVRDMNDNNDDDKRNDKRKKCRTRVEVYQNSTRKKEPLTRRCARQKTQQRCCEAKVHCHRRSHVEDSPRI